jgi:hypothetical protein
MDITSDGDLINLIHKGIESPDLDYKEDIDLSRDNREEKAQITKDVIAMANSGGGLLISGVKQTTGGFIPQGMSETSLKSFDSTSLNEFIKNYADPPINTQTKIITEDQKKFGIILVPGFTQTPHVVIKNYQGVFSEGDLLVRSSSNNSIKASAHDLRLLLDKAVLRRQGTLKDFLQAALESQQPKLVGGSKPENLQAPFDRGKYKDAYKGFRIVSLNFSNLEFELRPMNLRTPVQKSIIYTPYGSPFFPPADPTHSTESRLPIGITFEHEYEMGGSNLSFTFFGLSANVFTVESLWEDTKGTQHPEGSVGFFSCFRMIYAALLFGKRYYRALDINGDFQIHFSLESSIARSMVMDSRGYWSFHQQYINDMSVPISIQKSIRTDASIEKVDSLAKEMIREFCWYFHFDLSEADNITFLEKVKKEHVAVPKDVLQVDEGDKE